MFASFSWFLPLRTKYKDSLSLFNSWMGLAVWVAFKIPNSHASICRGLALSSVQLVQLLSCVWLFVTPWTAARQASLSITNSQSLLKLMSIESVMPSNHLILCCPLPLLLSIFPRIKVFSSESVFTSGGRSIGASTLASVLPMNIQDWFPLGSTGFDLLV